MTLELLDEVLEAHGGAERWGRARAIRAEARTGGLLPRTRMPGNRFADYQVTVEVAEPRAVLDPFPGPGRRGVFDGGEVRIETSAGAVVASRSRPREAFFGVTGIRRSFRWDALDATYFAGYAMWNYLTAPHLLTREGVEAAEGKPWDEAGVTWRRLEVDFPEGLDTHCPHQTFYFEPSGLLRRLDYRAPVIGRWARAAHLCDRHVESDGLVFPTSRRVRPRRPDGRVLGAPTMVSIELANLHVDSG